MCLCMKSARYLLTYLDCCLFLFIKIILFLSIYILLHIFNAFSAPCCNAFILCKALWIVLYLKCAIQINLTLTTALRGSSLLPWTGLFHQFVQAPTVFVCSATPPADNSIEQCTFNDGVIKHEYHITTDIEGPEPSQEEETTLAPPVHCFYVVRHSSLLSSTTPRYLQVWTVSISPPPRRHTITAVSSEYFCM